MSDRVSTRWDRHFLQLCLDHARMSKDPSSRVGAVIVGPDREIRSSGYNGLPRGIADTAERLNDRDTKLQLVVHAEMNAILAAARVGVPLKGCTLYACVRGDAEEGQRPWGAPCVRCAMHVIQAGIAEVVTPPVSNVPARWLEDMLLARRLLAEAGVAYREVPGVDTTTPGG